ncbi:tRNA (adenosine(37)-N6)-threonylcarbamoyltransferase complex ATPase subunit type 1 TsaE [Deinococcus cellulosilyticus]|uniref:tRNA threonylcarbamoyladenosine biosynthesis protein TsaE n=1 Tax=Deinococcus cellulosilyticus (strain DSM 18568 / NBRC 106333 / KACC 11606 / 5516J-15) TaxID=1223518 RepID=A0A511N2K3_DEIC1|nr:tRNA (adenosine(37)-N6)-threonylcarbamoyltransferase complex ATPase subunit type 1 TsaE [Deinococcus cellulosilyticus]GEM47062.1 tRNA (adenosine(37)-N6)-threonylcarbamoyltransferase complex ATPase subunit type 1 TsaE [Deinococcus cellulosilyticus NBRC 106333 = KACC 11606]
MQVTEHLLLKTPEAQFAFGQTLVSQLPTGTVLFLEGEMGAGKTTLTQGLLKGLGFTGEVNSPTYALMHEYPSPEGLVLHVDAYRIHHPDELYEMGLDDYVERCRLSIIEWGESLYADFPQGWILKLEYVPDGRKITRLR